MTWITRWAWLILIGSTWGLAEVFGGDLLDRVGATHTSAWLTACAVLMLGIGRGVANRPGSSTVLGLIAALFRLTNAAPHHCHLLGIVTLAVVFDVTATLLIREHRRQAAWGSLVGVASALGGATTFALLARFLLIHQRWIAGGWAAFTEHVVRVGAPAAAAAAILVPLAFALGRQVEAPLVNRPRWALIAPSSAALGAWLLGAVL